MVPTIDLGDIEAFEDHVSFEENVVSNSDGALNAPVVIGKRYCRSCLHMTTEESSAFPKATLIQSIKTLIDRKVASCVIFALESRETADQYSVFGENCNSQFVVVAERLRAPCSRSKEGGSLVRFVPSGEVFRSCQALCEFQNEAGAKVIYNIN